MKIKMITRLSVGLLTLGLISTSYATGAGFYLGGQLGETNTHNKQQNLQTGNLFPGIPFLFNQGTTLVNANNTGVGGRIFMGYNVNSYFGIESGYTHFGATHYKVGSPMPPLAAGNPLGNPGIQENGFDILGKGSFPFSASGFGIFGKAGIAIVRTSLAGSLTTTFNNTTGQYVTKTGTTNYVRPAIAIGASYDITQRWVADLTLSRVLGGAGFQSGDLYSLGISYHFVDQYCGQFLC